MIALLIVTLLAPVRAVSFARYADVELRFDAGKIALVSLKLGTLDPPQPLRKWRGQFVLRVLRAGKIVDEDPFDFPLLAPAESEDVDEAHRKMAEELRRHVRATTTVRVGLPDGADALAVYDPLTKRTWPIALKESAPAAPASAPRAR